MQGIKRTLIRVRLENERNWIEMKKRNVIVVGLLSLSLLTGCTTDKIERSQQDIKQEKVEKAKKEIASENKREKASSTNLIIPNSNESTQTESTQTESTQTESTQTESTQTESTQTGSTQSESAQTESTQTENTQETTIEQHRYLILIDPTWWPECNANGHRTAQGFDTQSGKYYWCCDDCPIAVAYEICNEHNTPMTPEHMQLHLK